MSMTTRAERKRAGKDISAASASSIAKTPQSTLDNSARVTAQRRQIDDAIGNVTPKMRQAPSKGWQRPRLQAKGVPIGDQADGFVGVPAAAQSVSKINTPVIQRIVQSNMDYTVDPNRLSYYSTLDREKKLYDTEAEAWARDETFDAEFDPGKRYPTPYTRHQTNWNQVITHTGAGKWGPHTVSHVWLSENLLNSLDGGRDIRDIFREQVPEPGQIIEQVLREYPNSFKDGQLERYQRDYTILYNRFNAQAQNEEAEPKHLYELLMRLMQLDPYTTYGRGPASKKATKGKGERAGQSFDESIDRGGKWHDEEGYENYLDRRRSLGPA